jgi:hypothetical protein
MYLVGLEPMAGKWAELSRLEAPAAIFEANAVQYEQPSMIEMPLPCLALCEFNNELKMGAPRG